MLHNPNTLIQPRALECLVEFADANPKVGICGPKILNRDGTMQLQCRAVLPHPGTCSAISLNSREYSPRAECSRVIWLPMKTKTRCTRSMPCRVRACSFAAKRWIRFERSTSNSSPTRRTPITVFVHIKRVGMSITTLRLKLPTAPATAARWSTPIERLSSGIARTGNISARISRRVISFFSIGFSML